MNKKKLKALIKKEEGSKLDFKLKLDILTESGRKELAKDVCAIANSRGGRGYLIIGIEDKTKKIVGIEDNIYNEEKIQQIISSRCDPPIPISLDHIKLENKTIGVITIYDGNQKPYQVRDNGVFFIRRGSTTDVMRKQEIVSLLQENLNFNVEMCPIMRSSLEHLDINLVDEYLRLQGIEANNQNRVNLMENSGIIIKESQSGDYVVTLGGLLVFSHVNNMYIPHNMIKIINKINKKIDEVTIIQGELLKMLDLSEEILYKILPSGYPIYAVYEAVKNAVLYRDYTIFNKEIEVVINNNSIVVISPGVLAKGMGINSHNYLRRNMWIYEKLILLDSKRRFVKSGRGFTKMKKAFKNYGKVFFINSMKNNNFKVIYPSIKKFKNADKY